MAFSRRPELQRGGFLSETLEDLSRGRWWGEIDKALKRLWIPVTSAVLTVSLSLQLSKDETRMGGMDGPQLWRRLLVKQHQQEIKRWKRTTAWVRGLMCVYSCMFVLISAHVGLGKTKSGMPWSARDEHAERSNIGLSISISACRGQVCPFTYCPLNRPFWHLFVVMANSTWTLGKHLFPLQTKANRLLCLAPINLSLDWQRCVYWLV